MVVFSQVISTSISNGRKRRRTYDAVSEVPSGAVSSADLNHVCMIAFPNVIFYIPMHVRFGYSTSFRMISRLASHSLTNLTTFTQGVPALSRKRRKTKDAGFAVASGEVSSADNV